MAFESFAKALIEEEINMGEKKIMSTDGRLVSDWETVSSQDGLVTACPAGEHSPSLGPLPATGHSRPQPDPEARRAGKQVCQHLNAEENLP